jgi:two-component system response regulator YesN
MLYKVLVVEDEENIRKGIQYIINNMIESWTVAGAVEDGLLALDAIQREPVEFVLTDIRLPGMDGLKLIETIHREYPRILTAVLSGYANFDYAQSALQNSVIDYVLKPTTPEKIKSVLKKGEKILEGRALRGRLFTESVKKELIECEKLLYKELCNHNKINVEQALERIIDLAVFTNNVLPKFEDLAYLMDKVLELLWQDIINGGMNPENLNRVRSYIQKLPLILDTNGFIEWRKEITNFLLDGICAGYNKKNFLIEKIKTYLKEKYSDPVTLSIIAEEFRISANYLSGLFKKEAGVNFNDYLTKVRIDAAKKFLKSNQNYKVYEVAYMSGYPNERYFTKLFKTITGLTPLDYRNGDNSEKL